MVSGWGADPIGWGGAVNVPHVGHVARPDWSGPALSCPAAPRLEGPDYFAMVIHVIDQKCSSSSLTENDQ